MKTNRFYQSLFVLIALGMLTLSSCKKEDQDDDDTQVEESSTAVLFAERFNTPDGRVMFMGAYPDIPSTEPDRSSMIELSGLASVWAHNGHPYVYDGEAGTMTKWEVNNSLEFSEVGSFSFANTGLTGNNYTHAFISDTEAYSPDLSEGVIVKWNPSTMEIEETIQIATPPTDNAWHFESYVSGDHIFIIVDDGDWDNLVAKKMTLGIFNYKTHTMTYVQDDRMLAGSMGHVRENGDFYLEPYSSSSFLSHYGSKDVDAPAGNMLRVKAGEVQIDPNFEVDLNEIIGSEAVLGQWPIEGSKMIVQSIMDSTEIPTEENMWDFWSAPQVNFKLVDYEAETSVDFPGLSSKRDQTGNLRRIELDGKSYFQLYDWDENGDLVGVTINELTENGLTEVFPITGGDILALERLR